MLKTELLELIANGENSGVEFKRDDIRPEQLAKEVVAMANFQGGRVLLGVEDDGTVSSIQRPDLEEWVMNIFQNKIHPMILPFYEEVKLDDGKTVAVVSFPIGISKPYVLRHSGKEEIYIRVGTTSRLATREQQMRLFELGGMLHTEVMPVPRTDMSCLDDARLMNYIRDILRDPDVPQSTEAWQARLLGLGFLTEAAGNICCTIAGLILFGKNPRRYLKQAGLRVMAFQGDDKEYQAALDEIIDGPMVGRWDIDQGDKRLVDGGVIERFMEAMTPFISQESAHVNEELRREMHWFYALEAVREALINALAHRDWTRFVEIEVSAYSNRLEIISPGTLPNSMTVEKMKAGQRSPRNTIVMEVLRDYGYVDYRGMGVRTKIVPLTKALTGKEPEFELTEDYLKTVLYR
ncbi:MULTISPECIES: RNA-binding domain-containing protein [Acinetobacter]|jgi:ATP-dependent DNA helicase RecG|uniref:Divergent AAA domain protein n=2 Tax=Acinetobacter TaxID=469 RepID=A0A009HI47_ACIB9|nr:MULTISPECIES: RNA-binding domain-containing protein [Acinetobacter]MBP8206204.1 putative DNA binding domain-containing protein [Acinetobacter sp.]MDU2408979.1 ATP-binding protein [Acinetobacter junii]EXB03872.1 divergent AAA domain protein [Acinetobacter baumannii 1295743]MCH7309579.1 putative DNA binding domain-containing protein [Acinetobacter sp. NIPH 1852]SJX22608.1 Divergent AAA domain protein [Acinetobacter johnsonii]